MFTWANVTNYRVGIVISLVYAVAIYQIYTQGITAIMSFLIIKEKAAKETIGLYYGDCWCYSYDYNCWYFYSYSHDLTSTYVTTTTTLLNHCNTATTDVSMHILCSFYPIYYSTYSPTWACCYVLCTVCCVHIPAGLLSEGLPEAEEGSSEALTLSPSPVKRLLDRKLSWVKQLAVSASGLSVRPVTWHLVTQPDQSPTHSFNRPLCDVMYCPVMCCHVMGCNMTRAKPGIPSLALHIHHTYHRTAQHSLHHRILLHSPISAPQRLSFSPIPSHHFLSALQAAERQVLEDRRTAQFEAVRKVPTLVCVCRCVCVSVSRCWAVYVSLCWLWHLNI